MTNTKTLPRFYLLAKRAIAWQLARDERMRVSETHYAAPSDEYHRVMDAAERNCDTAEVRLHCAATAFAGRYQHQCERCVAMAPIVAAFADAMMRKLHTNHHKGDRAGWMKFHPVELAEKAGWELIELRQEVPDESVLLTPEWKQRILDEAADVANMVMMIADRCGAVRDEDAAHHEEVVRE